MFIWVSPGHGLLWEETECGRGTGQAAIQARSRPQLTPRGARGWGWPLRVVQRWMGQVWGGCTVSQATMYSSGCPDRTEPWGLSAHITLSYWATCPSLKGLQAVPCSPLHGVAVCMHMLKIHSQERFTIWGAYSKSWATFLGSWFLLWEDNNISVNNESWVLSSWSEFIGF